MVGCREWRKERRGGGYIRLGMGQVGADTMGGFLGREEKDSPVSSVV